MDRLGLPVFKTDQQPLRFYRQKKQRDLLDGIFTKIGVKILDVTHQSINQVLRYPYVNDVFEWTDKKDKTKEYEIVGGECEKTITAKMIKAIGRRTEIELVDQYNANSKKQIPLIHLSFCYC